MDTVSGVPNRSPSSPATAKHTGSSMVASPTLRPQVLPTPRLLAKGVAVPELRTNLRTIANGRNVLSVVSLWAWLAAEVLAGMWAHSWLVWAVLFILSGPLQARFAILSHEAAHRLLFSNRRANDWVGMWLLAYPVLIPIRIYRRAHFAHHKDEFGPDEPDMAFYSGYQCTPRTLARRLARDAFGISGAKLLRSLVQSLGGSGRRIAASIIGTQLLMFAVLWAATGQWWVYLVIWLGPWCTIWRVLNRLRSIAEHGGLERSSDRRATTHSTAQSPWARFWVVPYHTGLHLAHHVDMGIPWRNLPAFQRELLAAGYIPPALTYPSYTALWRELAAG